MSLKIGQREVTAWAFIGVSILAVLLGKTPEQVLPLLLEVMAPLALVLTTFVNFTNVIQTRVANGTLNAGSLKELFKTRETYYALAILIAGAISVAGKSLFHIEFSSEMKTMIVNVVWNGGMVLGNILLASFAERQPTAQLTHLAVQQSARRSLLAQSLPQSVAEVPLVANAAK